MAQIDAMTKALAITAGEAAGMILDDLITALGRAIEAGRISALVIIVAELARRFPSCAHILADVERLARQIQRAKANPSLFGGRAKQETVLRSLAVDLRKAIKSFADCIAYLPPREGSPG